MGFNCMAVDLRSGGSSNGIDNETLKRANEAGLPTKYVNAYQDIEAAIAYAKEKLAKGKLIIWGSSYSSALVLNYAGEHQDIDGVLSFSPGEYFTSQGKSNTYITDAAAKIQIPVFITSAKGEKKSWSGIYDAIPSEQKTYFLPETDGRHGSRALWGKFDDSDAYWVAVKTFLENNFL
jgi:alpha-beta hydrolase superfamily lysophospholipase